MTRATLTDGRRTWRDVPVAWTPRVGELVTIGRETFEVSEVRGNNVRLRRIER
jgi:hypothetical protein